MMVKTGHVLRRGRIALRAVLRRLECHWVGNWGGLERVGLAKRSALRDGSGEDLLLWYCATERCLGCGYFHGVGGSTQ